MIKFFNIKKIENMSLISQLTFLTLSALIISLAFFYLMLRVVLLPFYEENVYKYLTQPANYIRISNNTVGQDVAFVIQTTNGATLVSDNFYSMFNSSNIDEVLNQIKTTKGKINVNNSIYYYVVGEGKELGSLNKNINILFTSDKLIKEQQQSLNTIIVPTMIITIAIITSMLFTWSKFIVKKIKILKEKTENIDNDKYNHNKSFVIDDELNMLNISIEQTRENLKQKEEYKNLMFQSLSHELKTPISVINSYIEGIQDNIIDEKEALTVIKEESNRLNEQVKSLLHFNKIDYMKDIKNYKDSKVNLNELINKSINKHKLKRKDVTWTINAEDKTIYFQGTEDMWQNVIDNILNNFERYAYSKINIYINRNNIIFENDGEKIPDNLINNIFLPYTKGPKGQFGLGLGIVKNTVNLFGYDIIAKNKHDLVKFEIYKNNKDAKD